MVYGDMRPTTREAERKCWQESTREKDKKIERLRKEKEWLITQLCKDWDQDAHGTEKEDLKGFINKQMQQALEEGKC